MYFTVLHFYKIVCVSDMFKMFAGIVCFTSLKYMVLKPLVRTSSFRLINLFDNVSFIFCCIFLRDLGKNLFLRLYKAVCQFTFFIFYFYYYYVILDHLLPSYCVVCSSLWRILLRCTFSKFHLLQMSGNDLINDS